MSQSVPTWADVVARLDCLEAKNLTLWRQNRRMKQLVVMTLIFAGVVVFLARVESGHADDPKTKKVIEANEFVVKDESGKTRAKLTTGSLILNNENGDKRLVLWGEEKRGGPGIVLFSSNDQKQQISILRTAEGLLAFGINDKNGKTRVFLATRPDGKPALLLQDDNQKAFFSQAQP